MCDLVLCHICAIPFFKKIMFKIMKFPDLSENNLQVIYYHIGTRNFI